MGSWFGGGRKEEPQMIAPPPPAPTEPLVDPEKAKRVGRTQLISTSARGVLGNPSTSRKQLSAV